MPFDNNIVKSLCKKFDFKQHKFSMYNALANGLAEAFNKKFETVLPLEQQIPSLQIAIQEGLTSEENAQLLLAELEALDEKKLEAQQILECYQARLDSLQQESATTIIPRETWSKLLEDL
ncbi:uncharacterized protein LOC142175693 [Nicotiana tabacum]|uniref:Uncharacterized protein LOC142175693 n=1 Tax=Nicotiana tabacum TaxID=4097 RepID=A0AC58TNH4_TOBAC